VACRRLARHRHSPWSGLAARPRWGDESQLDKLAHLLGYALLMFWWAQLVVQKRWKLAVAVVLFGIAIELLQGLTPERQPDPLDALANVAGALLGWLAARLLPNLPARIAALSALRR
jgi:VanZ family protein